MDIVWNLHYTVPYISPIPFPGAELYLTSYMPANTHTHTHIDTYTCTLTNTLTRKRTHPDTHTHTYKNMRIHNTNTPRHIHALVFSQTCTKYMHTHKYPLEKFAHIHVKSQTNANTLVRSFIPFVCIVWEKDSTQAWPLLIWNKSIQSQWVCQSKRVCHVQIVCSAFKSTMYCQFRMIREEQSTRTIPFLQMLNRGSASLRRDFDFDFIFRPLSASLG